MRAQFSHENTSHPPEEVDTIIRNIITLKDYTLGEYYNSSLGNKTDKFMTKSFITDILKTFDPDQCKFAEHIRTKYSCYAIYQGKQKKYTIYRCDQHNEFYIYVRHSDDMVCLFTCKC